MNIRIDRILEARARALPQVLGVIAAAVLAASGLPGCASKEGGAVEKAPKITHHLNEGRGIMNRLNEELDLNDPRNAPRALESMHRAEKLFLEAVRLGPTSSRPRIALANCLHLISLVHLRKHEGIAEEVEEAGRSTGRVKVKLLKEMKEELERARSYARNSNRQLLFYSQHLMGSFPDPFVYEAMASNYEILEEWRNAERAIELFLANADPGGEVRKRFEQRLRVYRQKRLEGEDSDEGRGSA
ncbi:MAG: hypothetical protein ACE5GW_06030 [Planctomycetota bacterium]